MKVYECETVVKVDEELEFRQINKVLKEKVEDITIVCDKWEDLIPVYESFGLCLPFTVYNSKKHNGYKILFFKMGRKSLRSWKDDMCRIEIEIKYTESSCKLKDLMEFDVEDVIKFCKERGIAVNISM